MCHFCTFNEADILFSGYPYILEYSMILHHQLCSQPMRVASCTIWKVETKTSDPGISCHWAGLLEQIAVVLRKRVSNPIFWLNFLYRVKVYKHHHGASFV